MKLSFWKRLWRRLLLFELRCIIENGTLSHGRMFLIEFWISFGMIWNIDLSFRLLFFESELQVLGECGVEFLVLCFQGVVLRGEEEGRGLVGFFEWLFDRLWETEWGFHSFLWLFCGKELFLAFLSELKRFARLLDKNLTELIHLALLMLYNINVWLNIKAV